MEMMMNLFYIEMMKPTQKYRKGNLYTTAKPDSIINVWLAARLIIKIVAVLSTSDFDNLKQYKRDSQIGDNISVVKRPQEVMTAQKRLI